MIDRLRLGGSGTVVNQDSDSSGVSIGGIALPGTGDNTATDTAGDVGSTATDAIDPSSASDELRRLFGGDSSGSDSGTSEETADTIRQRSGLIDLSGEDNTTAGGLLPGEGAFTGPAFDTVRGEIGGGSVSDPNIPGDSGSGQATEQAKEGIMSFLRDNWQQLAIGLIVTLVGTFAATQLGGD